MRRLADELVALADDLELDPDRAERAIFERADRLGCEVFAAFLGRFDTDAERVSIDGVEHVKFARKPKTYRCARGAIRLERNLYRPRGARGGPQACPLEIAAGLVRGQWTPRCAELMAYLAAELPERAAARLGHKLGALAYSASSFQRVAREVAARFEAEREVYESAIAETELIAEEARSASVAIDRVSLLMSEPGELNWRIAYCGCVALYDRDGEPLQGRRYGRLHDDAGVIREQMEWDARALSERRPELEWVALSDGAAEMCAILDEEHPGAERLVDFYHVVEKLGAAARTRASAGSSAVARWKLWLLNDDRAIERIESEIESWGARHKRVGDSKPRHEALTSIANHREQMRYATVRGAGPADRERFGGVCVQAADLDADEAQRSALEADRSTVDPELAQLASEREVGGGDGAHTGRESG